MWSFTDYTLKNRLLKVEEKNFFFLKFRKRFTERLENDLLLSNSGFRAVDANLDLFNSNLLLSLKESDSGAQSGTHTLWSADLFQMFLLLVVASVSLFTPLSHIITSSYIRALCLKIMENFRVDNVQTCFRKQPRLSTHNSWLKLFSFSFKTCISWCTYL